MKVLVTGSEGFIGSHLVKSLVRQGHHGVCLIRYNSLSSHGWQKSTNKAVKTTTPIQSPTSRGGIP